MWFLLSVSIGSWLPPSRPVDAYSSLLAISCYVWLSCSVDVKKCLSLSKLLQVIKVDWVELTATPFDCDWYNGTLVRCPMLQLLTSSFNCTNGTGLIRLMCFSPFAILVALAVWFYVWAGLIAFWYERRHNRLTFPCYLQTCHNPVCV